MRILQNILSNANFMPHGQCYLWRPDILWTHVIADAIIAFSYFAIPITLIVFFLHKRKAVPFSELVVLFGAFIFLCGTTHLFRIYVTWVPMYYIEGWIKALTAIVSVITAIILAPKLPKLIAVPGVKQAYEKSQLALREAHEKNAQMETIVKVSIEREERILDLKEEVNTLLKELKQSPRYEIHN